MIQLVLPLPPSKNRLYSNAKRWTRGKDGRSKSYMARMKSPRYQAFEQEVAAEVWRQTTIEQREELQRVAAEEPLTVSVTVCFPPDDKTRDVVNLLDALMDAIKGPLGVDDSRFQDVSITQHQAHWGAWEGPPCRVEIRRY